MDEKFLKPYNPEDAEPRMYKLWEESGYFNPDNLPGERTETFSIVLPPPNVTGTLHMGHAAMLAVEDILVRHARMNGKKTLWLPGTDSAAIATQSKVEKIIQKEEGLTRNQMGRDAFLERVNAFALESQSTILNQCRRMGSSLDWSRLAYTLDDKRYKAVMTAFVTMYEAGLIYRGDRIVNWDPKGQTVISDDEIVYTEEKTKFYYLKYGPFTIGTARPETKFGDKYVVMHPEDKRYKEYTHGQKIDLEWINGPITATVIKDESIDREFGTGVMTITPWHSMVDFEIAKRHGLEKEQVIDQYGKLLPIAGDFAGIKISEARAKIIEKLETKGLVDRIEDYTHNVATAERSGGTIEPQIMRQWFVDVEKPFPMKAPGFAGIASGEEVSLKAMMHKAVESNDVVIMPEHFAKIYHHWIDNLHDWCISRQIWFGHRIPVWYRADEMYVGVTAPEGEGWEQDPDTLDTWFSSGLWTFSTLGWPEETADLKTYHPTAVLETGYDILFFWVARMILMSGFHLGTVPFKHVYLHGLVRDNQGRKMSKSIGNIIDPLDLIAKYGADAARMSLIVGAAVGNDIKLSEDKVKGYKNFANKLWNIARFTLTNTEDTAINTPRTENDQMLLDEFKAMAADISADIEAFRLHLASEKLYHYAWHRLADVILEESKPIFKDGTPEARGSRAQVLYMILTDLLKLLHPFMPFVTEEIWQALPHKDSDLLIVAPWPK